MTSGTTRFTFAVTCALAVMAGAFRFTAAPGPGLDPDAMSYLGAARTLAADGTLRIPMAPWWSDSTTQPLTHFPPGYSAVLAVPVAFRLNAVQGARVVQSVAAGATAAIFMLALWPLVGAWGAVLGAVALALTPAYAFVHLSVLSEPLFLALMMLMMWSLFRRPRAPLMHGVIAAAATMVRYAGLSMAGAAALWALRDSTATWRERMRRAALAIAPSLLAMAAWTLTREHAPGRGEPIRKLAFYGDWGPTLHEGARTVAHQLAPTLEWEPTPWLAAAVALAAIAAMIWSTVRQSGGVMPSAEPDDSRRSAQGEMLRAAGCLALAYVGLVVASRALADPAIPFDFRMTVPLVPPAVAAVTIIAVRAWRIVSRPVRVVGVVLFIGWTAAAIRANHQQVTDALADGSDFASAEWRNSPTLAWVHAQDPSRALFTNLPCEIWFHLDRQVRNVPDSTDVATMRAFTAKLRATNGVMVAWNLQSPETAHTDSIAVHSGLVRIAQFEDGSVFEMPSASPRAAPPVTRAGIRAPGPVAPPAIRR